MISVWRGPGSPPILDIGGLRRSPRTQNEQCFEGGPRNGFSINLRHAKLAISSLGRCLLSCCSLSVLSEFE